MLRILDKFRIEMGTSNALTIRSKADDLNAKKERKILAIHTSGLIDTAQLSERKCMELVSNIPF